MLFKIENQIFYSIEPTLKVKVDCWCHLKCMSMTRLYCCRLSWPIPRKLETGRTGTLLNLFYCHAKFPQNPTETYNFHLKLGKFKKCLGWVLEPIINQTSKYTQTRMHMRIF